MEGGDHDTTVNSTAPPAPATTGGHQVIVKQTFVQGHDNPFTADGELSHKADFILRHSTISRTELKIVDPDSPVPVVEEAQEEVVATTQSGLQSAPPPSANGQVDDSVKPKDVKVDVDNKGENAVDGADPADKGKSKDPKKKCQCCVVM